MPDQLTKNQKDLLVALNRNGHRVYKTQEIDRVVDFTRQTTNNNLNQLIDAGLVKKVTHGKYQLTGAGQEALEEVEEPTAIVEPEVQNERLKGLENRLPSKAHVALFELAVSTIYAKQNLFDEYDKGWPGFVLYGPTKTYKTSLGEDILKTVGIDPTEAVKNLETASPGEIGIRHRKVKGGGYTAEPSYALDYPAFVFDELDKAGSKIKDKVQVYLQSWSSDMSEGKKIDLQMVPIVTLNTNKIEDVLPESFIRRSFLMDTSDLNVQEDIDLQAREIKGYLKRSLCNPHKPNNIDFPEDLFHSVRKFYKPLVKDNYWNSQADLPPPEITLKGRMLSPLSSGDPRHDVVDNAYRLLQLAETRGKTIDRWRSKFAELTKDFTESEELQKAFEKKEREAQRKKRKIEKRKQRQEEKNDEAKAEKVKEVTDEYELILAKQDIISKLENLRDALYPLGLQKANRDARPARKMIDKLVGDLDRVNSREGLETYARAFQEVKQKPEFRKGVKIAILRRAFETNNLRLNVVDWDYFIDQKSIDQMKKQAKEASNKEEKQIPGDSQTKTTQSKGKTKKPVPSIPSELKRPRQKKQKSEKSPPSGPSEIPPPPKKQGFFTELLNFATPGRSDYKARKERYEQKKNDAELAAIKERGKEIRKNARIREKQREENRAGRPRHGTPADEL